MAELAAKVWEAPEVCPVCGGHMIVERLRCVRCASALEGAFEPHSAAGDRVAPSDAQPAAGRGEGLGEGRYGRLARLSDEQLEFVEVFLRCRGVIKNVEDMLGVSYPTVKGRLNNALEAMGFGAEDEGASSDQRRAQREILAALAAGRISAEEAHDILGALAAGRVSAPAAQELLASLASGALSSAELRQTLSGPRG